MRKRISILISILILSALLISGCVKRIYVPDPGCEHSIELLMEELKYKDAQLQDCLEELRE